MGEREFKVCFRKIKEPELYAWAKNLKYGEFSKAVLEVLTLLHERHALVMGGVDLSKLDAPDLLVEIEKMLQVQRTHILSAIQVNTTSSSLVKVDSGLIEPVEVQSAASMPFPVMQAMSIQYEPPADLPIASQDKEVFNSPEQKPESGGGSELTFVMPEFVMLDDEPSTSTQQNIFKVYKP